MVISEETRLINYIFNVLRGEKILKRALINYKIELDSRSIEPDFLAYLNGDIYNNYILLEIKNRTIDDDLDKIKDQYSRYCDLDQKHLDSSIIPVIFGVPIYIDYIFYDTPANILQKICQYVDFGNENSILFYSTRGEARRIINRFQKSILDKNIKITNLLIENSRNLENWENFLIPFIKKDLIGIRGGGGSSLNVEIESKVSFSIILSHLCTFIISRKIREEGGRFDTETLFDYIFSRTRPIFKFGDADTKNIIKKLRLFLNSVAGYCIEENFVLIDKVKGNNNEFIIRIRRTDTLNERIEGIREELYKKIKFDQSQKKITDFI